MKQIHAVFMTFHVHMKWEKHMTALCTAFQIDYVATLCTGFHIDFVTTLCTVFHLGFVATLCTVFHIDLGKCFTAILLFCLTLYEVCQNSYNAEGLVQKMCSFYVLYIRTMKLEQVL